MTSANLRFVPVEGSGERQRWFARGPSGETPFELVERIGDAGRTFELADQFCERTGPAPIVWLLGRRSREAVEIEAVNGVDAFRSTASALDGT